MNLFSIFLNQLTFPSLSEEAKAYSDSPITPGRDERGEGPWARWATH